MNKITARIFLIVLIVFYLNNLSNAQEYLKTADTVFTIYGNSDKITVPFLLKIHKTLLKYIRHYEDGGDVSLYFDDLKTKYNANNLWDLVYVRGYTPDLYDHNTDMAKLVFYESYVEYEVAVISGDNDKEFFLSLYGPDRYPFVCFKGSELNNLLTEDEYNALNKLIFEGEADILCTTLMNTDINRDFDYSFETLHNFFRKHIMDGEITIWEDELFEKQAGYEKVRDIYCNKEYRHDEIIGEPVEYLLEKDILAYALLWKGKLVNNKPKVTGEEPLGISPVRFPEDGGVVYRSEDEYYPTIWIKYPDIKEMLQNDFMYIDMFDILVNYRNKDYRKKIVKTNSCSGFRVDNDNDRKTIGGIFKTLYENVTYGIIVAYRDSELNKPVALNEMNAHHIDSVYYIDPETGGEKLKTTRINEPEHTKSFIICKKWYRADPSDFMNESILYSIAPAVITERDRIKPIYFYSMEDARMILSDKKFELLIDHITKNTITKTGEAVITDDEFDKIRIGDSNYSASNLPDYFNDNDTINITYELLSDNYIYIKSINDKTNKTADSGDKKLIPYKVGSKQPSYENGITRYGYSNEKEKILIPARYDKAWMFSCGAAKVMNKFNLEKEKYGFINTKGENITEIKYDNALCFSNDRAAVKINNKWGFIDLSGNEVIPPAYDSVKCFSENMAAVCLSNKWGYIDNNGKKIVEIRYDQAEPFRYGKGLIKSGEMYHLVNNKGKEVVKGMEEFIDYDDEIIICVPGALTIMNKKGKIKYQDDNVIWAKNYSQGLIAVEQDSKWGFMNTSLELVIPCKYNTVTGFSEGMAAVELDKKWGYINKTGKEVIPLKYMIAYPFSDGLAAVSDNYFIFGAEELFNYEYINKTGETIIPPVYYSISGTSFMNGLLKTGSMESNDEAYINKNGTRYYTYIF